MLTASTLYYDKLKQSSHRPVLLIILVDALAHNTPMLYRFVNPVLEMIDLTVDKLLQRSTKTVMIKGFSSM